MYGIGIFEIFLIFLVMLLFFKPAEIFTLFRRIGGWYGKYKQLEDDLKKDWDTGSAADNESFGFDSGESNEKGESL